MVAKRKMKKMREEGGYKLIRCGRCTVHLQFFHSSTVDDMLPLSTLEGAIFECSQIELTLLFNSILMLRYENFASEHKFWRKKLGCWTLCCNFKRANPIFKNKTSNFIQHISIQNENVSTRSLNTKRRMPQSSTKYKHSLLPQDD